MIIAGDSMVRDLKRWLMSRSKFVKVFSLGSGATTEDMKSCLVPLIEKKPDHIILNVGTNDLTGATPESIFEKILGLADMIRSKGIKCSASQLIIRDDQLWHKGKRVNQILSERLPKHISLVSNEKITVNHLNGSQVHLNRRGVKALAYNFISFMKGPSFKQTCL